MQARYPDLEGTDYPSSRRRGRCVTLTCPEADRNPSVEDLREGRIFCDDCYAQIPRAVRREIVRWWQPGRLRWEQDGRVLAMIEAASKMPDPQKLQRKRLYEMEERDRARRPPDS